MFSYLGKLAAVAAVAIPLVFSAPTPYQNKIRNLDTVDVVANSYIVVYNNDITAEAITAHVESISGLISKRDTTLENAGIAATYDLSELKGYNVIADAATIAAIAEREEVSIHMTLFKLTL